METTNQHYIAKNLATFMVEITAAEKKENCLLAIAIKKDTCSLFKMIAYEAANNKDAATRLVNDIYWNNQPKELDVNGLSEWNGREICNKLQLIVINDAENLKTLKRLINELNYWLNNLNEKIAGKSATAVENMITKLGKTIKL